MQYRERKGIVQQKTEKEKGRENLREEVDRLYNEPIFFILTSVVFPSSISTRFTQQTMATSKSTTTSNRVMQSRVWFNQKIQCAADDA